MSFVTSSVFAAQAASGLACGWLSDRWTASGRAEADIRKTLAAGGQLGAAVCIVAITVTEDNNAMIAWLVLTGIFGAATSANIFTIGQIFAGRAQPEAGRNPELHRQFSGNHRPDCNRHANRPHRQLFGRLLRRCRDQCLRRDLLGLAHPTHRAARAALSPFIP